jgi:glycine/D-amino acid oxidase-like deaminating enzyme
MSAHNGKILVVGGGIAGLATAWALNRRGLKVELFEQGALPHPRGSSYDEHRIIRHAYGDLEGYAYLMPDAFRIWDALWADLGVRHFDPMPVIYFMRGDSDWYPATLRSLRRMGVGCADIPLDEVAGRYPMIRPDGLTRVVETAGGGILYPIRILTDLVKLLAARGVALHPHTQVEAVDLESGTVQTRDGIMRGDAVVVTAGAWAARLLPSLTGIAVPSRQAVMYLAPPPDLADAWRSAPVLIDLGTASGTYTLPPRPGTRLKIGDHQFTRQGDPDGDRTGTDADVARLTAAAHQAWRDFGRYTVLERKACFYTVTADERFLVRREGAKGWLGSACSGHGFKLAPLIGDALAATIAGDRDATALPDWAAGSLIPA